MDLFIIEVQNNEATKRRTEPRKKIADRMHFYFIALLQNNRPTQ